jgi:hypothetical protein
MRRQETVEAASGEKVQLAVAIFDQMTIFGVDL